MNDWKRILVIMFVAQMLSAIGFSMIFPFLPNYVESLGSAWNLDLVFLAGAVFSAQAITMMLASPVWGAVADRVGRKPMVQRALLGGAAIILLMAYAQNAEQLVLMRAVQGVLTGVVSAGNALVASVAPRERSGFALGALQTALTSGVALGPVLGGVLADTVGYRAAFVITAGLLLLGGVLVQFGVKESFTPPAQARRLSGMARDWSHILRTPGVGRTFAARFSAWLGRGVMVPILPLFVPFLLSEGARTSTFTGLVIGIAAATSTLSAIALGNLGDRIGHRAVLIGSSAVAAACYLPMAFVETGWQLLLLNGMAGVAIGGVMPSLSALLNVVTEQTEVGSAFGLDNAVIAASRAVAPLVGVGLAALLGGGETGYRAVFLSAAALFGVTILIATGLQRTRPHPRPAHGD
ncbi:MAG: MFS transporter [Trueperaceae bacterium]|nr:MFS transporter [Trueperaceae bacterium]